MVEQVSERWAVWCEHADGRRYRMGDAKEARWSQETAERVAKHMSTHASGTFVAQAFIPDAAGYTGLPSDPLYKSRCEDSRTALRAALQCYMAWQPDGDAGTFLSFVEDELREVVAEGTVESVRTSQSGGA